MPKKAAWTPSTLAFVTCMIVVFIDMMGQKFTEPALVPYATFLGMSSSQTSFVVSSRELGMFVSNLVMPRLADSKGRVLTVIISTAGSAVAYALQSGANWFPDNGFGWLLTGKIVAGLFGGTFPMLIAYSVELSSPDVDLVKYRQTMLVTVLMVSPVLMSPIGGGVARFGLVIPFIIAFGTASLGLLFVIFNMKDVADVKRAEARLEERGGDEEEVLVEEGGEGEGGGEEEEEAKQKNHEKLVQLEGSPFKDPVFLILSFGYMCLMAAVGSLVLFYSFTFTQESFGLTVAANATTGVLSEAQVTFNQEQVAAAVGIIPLPGSICMCLSMTVGYLTVSKRMGDRFCILVGGVFAGCAYASLSLASKLWHVSVMASMLGIGAGLMFGCMMNLPNTYPNQIATSKAVYFQGSTTGSIISAPLMVYVYERSPTHAWYLGGLLMFCSSFAMVAVEGLVKSRLRAGEWKARDYEDTLDEQQHREFLETGAVPEEEFLDQVREGVRAVLARNGYHLWNGRVQKVVLEAVKQALPGIRDFSKNPRGHLHDLGDLMRRNGMGDEARDMEERHGLLGGEGGDGDEDGGVGRKSSIGAHRGDVELNVLRKATAATGN
ncbi:hypothetical protein TeGR_g14890 [Tetraparma gracilis]|uniref:Major facilitator superfamily (MFS) profile domain-containing protein n=1 Tax=Tetraparma gracilis TaxID=2962635 RepID=A0ABQ6MD91_9STRA|nr:hypothetical protein TeGR_g14890 [Tetraparma gracilis]